MKIKKIPLPSLNVMMIVLMMMLLQDSNNYI